MIIYSYLIIGVLFISLLLSCALLIKNNEKLKFISNENQNLISRNLFLEENSIEQIKKIQNYESDLRNLEMLHQKIKHTEESYMQQAKSAISEISKSISSELVDLYRKDSEENRKITEENISKNVGKFHEKFEKISNYVVELNSKFNKSESDVNLIKNAMMNPIGAGKLAEITLENILSNSGLQKNIDYNIQPNFFSEDNSRLRPDAVIHISDENFLLIDAKASKFMIDLDENNDASKANFIKTINAHVKSLISKDYYGNLVESSKFYNNKSRSFTAMFLHTESAVERIAKYDPSIIEKAWQNNIFIVGPTGLMNILSLAKFQIMELKRSHNYDLIIQEIRGLVDAAVSVSENLKKLGTNIQSTFKYYDKLVGSFNKTFISKIKRVKNLGIGGTDKAKGMSDLSVDRYKLISSNEFKETDNSQSDDSESENQESETQEYNEDI